MRYENLQVPHGDAVARDLRGHGLDFNRSVFAWKESVSENPDTVFEYWIDKNLQQIKDIERDYPGGTQLLARNFNIYNFGFYPLPFLVHQIEHAEDNVPYGIIGTARYDRRGFSVFNKTFVIHSLTDMLRKDYQLRAVEAGSGLDLYHTMGKLDRRYGGSNKMSFGVLDSHGNSELIQMGEGRNEFITKDHLLSARASERFKQFFVKNPTIVLTGCSTGGNGGFAQYLSQALEARVIAPNALAYPVFIHRIDDLIHTPEIRFVAGYMNSDGIPVSSFEYFNGQRATDTIELTLTRNP